MINFQRLLKNLIVNLTGSFFLLFVTSAIAATPSQKVHHNKKSSHHNVTAHSKKSLHTKPLHTKSVKPKHGGIVKVASAHSKKTAMHTSHVRLAEAHSKKITKHSNSIRLAHSKSKKSNATYITPAAEAVKIAYAQIGKPYRYAADGPTEFDCSGLTKYCYSKAGVNIPHNAYAQFKEGKKVAYNDLKPGDLIFFRGAEHVGIYVGSGRYIHAPQTGELVRVGKLHSAHDFFGACRPWSVRKIMLASNTKKSSHSIKHNA